jgi:hypothetical protein
MGTCLMGVCRKSSVLGGVYTPKTDDFRQTTIKQVLIKTPRWGTPGASACRGLGIPRAVCTGSRVCSAPWRSRLVLNVNQLSFRIPGRTSEGGCGPARRLRALSRVYSGAKGHPDLPGITLVPGIYGPGHA